MWNFSSAKLVLQLIVCPKALDYSKLLLIYKTILKPIWTYDIKLWGTASTSNIEIVELFQSKVLSMIVD
jgi:hypothetical protein